MLAANQVMIGKCLKLKYSRKRSSVQVQSKRSFLNVSHKFREKKKHKILLEPCLQKNTVLKHHYNCREIACLGWIHLTYLLPYTPKYFQKVLRQLVMKYKVKRP